MTLKIRTLMISHPPAKFGGHRHCGSGDIFLICQVILQYHLIQEPCDLIGRSLEKIIQHPGKFGGYRHCGNADIIVLVCYVISQDYIINGSCDFMGRSPSR